MRLDPFEEIEEEMEKTDDAGAAEEMVKRNDGKVVDIEMGKKGNDSTVDHLESQLVNSLHRFISSVVGIPLGSSLSEASSMHQTFGDSISASQVKIVHGINNMVVNDVPQEQLQIPTPLQFQVLIEDG
ncbi:hypothetical protein PPACK8108_LOCUS13672, partial [Phakopsora pachyrhizi]